MPALKRLRDDVKRRNDGYIVFRKATATNDGEKVYVPMRKCLFRRNSRLTKETYLTG
jgi:hypothetical protein